MILNPSAGGGLGGRLQPEIQGHLETLGYSIRCHRTQVPGDGSRLAEELGRQGARQLLVCGGDGSLFEVVNGCLRLEEPRPRLAVVPLGRGNDFAKSLGVPMDWRDACDRVALGTSRRVDAGQCNDFFFINGLGLGLDARVAVFAQRYRRLPGDSVYVLGLLRALLHRPGVRIQIEDDCGFLDQEMTLVGVANGHFLGGRFQLAPEAAIDDGLLDLVVIPRLNRRQILRYAPRVAQGRADQIPGYAVRRVRQLRVRLAEPHPVQADGEVVYRGARELQLSVLPGALEFIC